MLHKLHNLVKSSGIFLQSYFLLIVRLYWGYQFAVAGYGKLIALDRIADFFTSLGIPLPFANALLVGFVELFGGILLALGLFSRVSGLILATTMAVAVLTAHTPTLVTLFTEFNPAPFFAASPFLFAYASLLVFLFGPGKISVDYLLSESRKTGVLP